MILAHLDIYFWLGWHVIEAMFNFIFILIVIQEGKFVHVSNKYELDTKVGSFYNFLTLDKSKANIQFSFPYVDFFGAGKWISKL